MEIKWDETPLVALLQNLIQFPTEDPPGHELELAIFIQDWLKKQGMDSDVNEFLPGRANVICRIKGKGDRPGLIFSSHLDTLPVDRSSWTFPPFDGEISNGRVYGRGTADIKGSMAAMMIVAKALKDEKTELGGDLILAFSGGESSNGLGSKEMVEDGSLGGAGAMLIGEPSSMKMVTAEAGALWLSIRAYGIPGHVSAGGSNNLRDNAILTLARKLDRLTSLDFHHTYHPLLGIPTINVGLIQGGSAINLRPYCVETQLDIRYLPGMSCDEILQKVQEVMGAEFTYKILDNKTPIEVPNNHPFVELCITAYENRIGTKPIITGATYFSDSSVIVPALDIPRVIVGPGELGMTGQSDEYVSIENLYSVASFYYTAAKAYLRDN